MSSKLLSTHKSSLKSITRYHTQGRTCSDCEAGHRTRGQDAIREAAKYYGVIVGNREEEKFRRSQKEILEKLKISVAYQIAFHEDQIKRHQEAVQVAKNSARALEKTEWRDMN